MVLIQVQITAVVLFQLAQISNIRKKMILFNYKNKKYSIKMPEPIMIGLLIVASVSASPVIIHHIQNIFTWVTELGTKSTVILARNRGFLPMTKFISKQIADKQCFVKNTCDLDITINDVSGTRCLVCVVPVPGTSVKLTLNDCEVTITTICNQQNSVGGFIIRYLEIDDSHFQRELKKLYQRMEYDNESINNRFF